MFDYIKNYKSHMFKAAVLVIISFFIHTIVHGKAINIDEFFSSDPMQYDISTFLEVGRSLEKIITGETDKSKLFKPHYRAALTYHKLTEKIMMSDAEKFVKYPTCMSYFMYYNELETISEVEDKALEHYMSAYRSLSSLGVPEENEENYKKMIFKNISYLLKPHFEYIEFDSNSSEIGLCAPRVDRLAILSKRILDEFDILQIAIIGHTDNIGSESANVILSKERAISIADILVSNGISPKKISVEGAGECCPVASNDSDYNRFRNRRIEVIFYEKK